MTKRGWCSNPFASSNLAVVGPQGWESKKENDWAIMHGWRYHQSMVKGRKTRERKGEGGSVGQV
jgi:hypothetical protein